MSTLDPGALFADRFEIERRAGSGGMGAVFCAHDRQTGNLVALKLMHQDGARPEARERFEREARLLAEIEHPGIVAYVAHGEAPDGRRFLVMEWLDGEDLAARLARGPLPLGACVKLVRRVAEALDVAHGRGVVHRDLKPSNLFLVGGAVEGVKVLDFGVARRRVASRAMTRTGTVVGTPDYMAPEQARKREITPAADVFSLGCVLHECLTGRPPFAAEHIAAVLARILFDDPPRVEDLRPGVPAPLAALLRRMLAKRPEERLPDAGALVAALDALGELPDDAGAPACAVRSPSVTITLEREGWAEESAPAPSGPAFAEREQGLFSLVVASAPHPPGAGATPPEEDARQEVERRRDVRKALAAMGLSADFVADGSLVVRVAGSGSALDQASLAARAALVIRERWPAAEVALATGLGAVEGAFAVGELADRAARLLTVAETSSGVRVDALSARLLGSRFTLAPSPEGAILSGEEREADVSRPLLGKPTSCVGRDAELGTLEALFAGCVEESEARAVLLTAPPGAGKSRLRHELLRRIERRGEPVTILAGRGDAMSAGAPYGVLATALLARAGVESGMPLEEQRALLRGLVGRHVAEADRERVVRFVGELCDIPFPDEGLLMLRAARHEPKIMGDCLRRAVLDFFAAECGAGPVLVVLDDLQWGDALTVSALDDALREQAGAPLLVLGLARPEVREAFPRLWHGHKVQEIALRGLSKKACERLIREVLGKDVPAAAVHRAVEQSAGNALFLEELIRAVAEGKGEERSETLVAMLQARMGRLPAGPRRALQAASVLGQTFWRGGVARVLTAAPSDVMGWLSALTEAELVQPSPASCLQGEKEYVFRHALVRDAAYGLLTASDIAVGHRLAGEFLAAAGEHDGAVVAEHFERGGDREKAATFYLRAAEDSLQRGDYTGARRVCEKGVGCAPEGEVLGGLKSVESSAGFFAHGDEETSGAARAAMTLLHPGSLGWCRAILAALYADATDPARMLELLSLLGATDPDPDPGARRAHIEAQSYVSGILTGFAFKAAIAAHLDRLESSVDVASGAIPAVRRYFAYARGFATVWRYPRPWSGVMDCRQALQLSQEVADQKFELVVRAGTTEVGWLELGDLEGARGRILALEEKLLQSQEGFVLGLWFSVAVLIHCEAQDPEAWAMAESLMARARASASAPLIFIWLAMWDVRLAFVQGRLEKTEELSRAAMALLPVAPFAWIGTAPARIRALLGLGRAAEACVVAEQIVGVLTRFDGTGHFEVEARLAVTEAFEAAGDHPRARTELAETLREIELRLDDIADPFWKNSYLTRNRSVACALALGRAWGVAAGPSA